MAKRRTASIKTMKGAKLLVSTYYSLQKERIQTSLRIQALERDEIAPESELRYLHDFMDEKLSNAENEIKKEMAYFIREVPIWSEFLEDVKGIGPILASGLVSVIESESGEGIKGIARFDTISKLWAFCGLHTVKVNEDGDRWFPSEEAARAFHVKHVKAFAERAIKKINVDKEVEKRMKKSCWGNDVETHSERAKKRAGQTANWNQFMKTLCWKIGESFIKSGGYYREQYDQYREQEDRLNERRSDEDKISKAHVFSRAKRKTVKLFLSDLWLKYRKLEGLPVRDPYVIDRTEHTTLKSYGG